MDLFDFLVPCYFFKPVRISSQRRARILAVFARLRQLHPDAHCELIHTNPFQLLVATVLSAQTTDRRVNQITPRLFFQFGTAELLARAPLEEVERILRSIGFFRTKARQIIGLAQQLVELHQGQVPCDFQALMALPGVGRKTANVILGDGFHCSEGIVVDTHVQRVSQRLGWTRETTPEKIEQDLMKIFPPKDWNQVAHVLIFHGRRSCSAQRPACSHCRVRDSCPSAGKAEYIGRKK